MGNNNNDNDLIADTRDNGSVNFHSKLVNNQNFVSDEERKDEMTTENTKQRIEIHTNEHESFISDIIKDLVLEAPTSQKKKKTKQNKEK